MTLVELLLVIAILAILLGAAVPILSPASDSRRMREASRGLNTFISGAQTRAKETGRPFGVALKKLAQDTNPDYLTDPVHEDNGVCLEVYYVEQPAPYAGFDENSRVIIAQDTRPGGDLEPGQFNVRFVTSGPDTSDGLPPGLDRELLPSLIYEGDRISIGDIVLQFNDGSSSKNPEFGFYNDLDSTIGAKVVAGNKQVSQSPIGNNVGQLFNAVYDNNGFRVTDPNTTGNAPYWTEPLRYKVLRQPVKTSTPPYQLPEGTAIDLEASGFANGTRLHNPFALPNNPEDVIVMFSPEGSVERVYHAATASGQTIPESLVTSNLFLLVGLRENIPAPTTDFSTSLTETEKEDAKRQINWLNGDARWVTVGAQTGAVVTAENAFVDPEAVAALETDLALRRVREINGARDIARQTSGVGGR